MHELVVDSAALSDAMRLLVQAGPTASASELSLSFEDGELLVELATASVAVPAEGSWPGVVTVQRGFLDALELDATGSSTLLVTGAGQLTVGGRIFDGRIAPHPRVGSWVRDLRGLMASGAGWITAPVPVLRRGRRQPDADPPHRGSVPAPGATLSAGLGKAGGLARALLRRWHWAAAAMLLAGLGYGALGTVNLPGPLYDVAIAARMPLGEPRQTRLAVAAYQSGHTAEAVAELTDAASRYRRSSAAQVELARIYQDLGDPGAAVLMLQQALTRAARDRDAILELGTHHYQQGLRRKRLGEPGPARAEFARATEVFSTADAADLAALGWLSCALHELGLAERAGSLAARAAAGPWLWCAPRMSP